MTTIVISSGVVRSGLTVSWRNELDIDSGGTAVSTTILDEGTEVVSSGGVADGGVISSGGDLYDFGYASGFHALAGADLFVSAGSANGSVIDGSMWVETGGFGSGDTVGANGWLEVSSGGSVVGSVVEKGGTLVLAGGGTSGDTVMSGGALSTPLEVQSGETYIVSGARVATPLTFDGVLLDSGATLSFGSATVSPHATLSLGAGSVLEQEITVDTGALLIGPGQASEVNDYGLIKGIVIGSGSSISEGVLVWQTGVADMDTIAWRGFEDIEGGAVAYGERVMGGGIQEVGHGRVVSTFVASGGQQIVATRFASAIHTFLVGAEKLERGGRSSDTLVESGGVELVSSASIATDSTVFAGGRVILLKGGALVGGVLVGGLLEVSSGGVVSGALAVSGGQAMIDGTVSGGVVFGDPGGYVRIDNVSAFHGAISGLTTSRDRIDLGELGFGSNQTATWSQTGTSGALTVVDPTQSATLTLVGGFATSDFVLSNDGHGGTLITLAGSSTAAAPAAAPIRFVEAMGGFHAVREATGPGWVQSGGSSLEGAGLGTTDRLVGGLRSR